MKSPAAQSTAFRTAVIVTLIGAIATAIASAVVIQVQGCQSRIVSDVPIYAQMHNYASTEVYGRGRFTVYYDGYVQPLLEISLTNQNGSTIDIDGVFVEVVDYVSPDEFSTGNDAGGADPVQNIFYHCAIDPQKREYAAGLTRIGEEVVSSADTYIAVASADTAELKVEMTPSAPGIYTIRARVAYKYDGRLLDARTGNQTFVYLEPQRYFDL